MDFSRRKLLTLGAASATAATAGLVVAPGAHATQTTADTDEVPLGHGTAYDRQEQQRNPENKLGCPLGKGA